MNFLDAILNLVALLLWIDWRSEKLLARHPRRGVTLAHSLKSTERIVLRPWLSFGALLALLLLRAFFYWNVGTAANWTPVMDLSVISLAWRSHLLLAVFLFSFVSFGLTLLAWVTCLLLLSVADAPSAAEHPAQRFIRLQLGWLDRLPAFLKLLVPFVISFLAWLALSPLFEQLQMLPAAPNAPRLFLQAAVLGLSVYIFWKWLLIVLFALHLLNTYIYLGNHHFWAYITHTARRLLWPVSFLRFGRVDLSPLAGILLVILLFEFGLEPLIRNLYAGYAL